MLKHQLLAPLSPSCKSGGTFTFASGLPSLAAHTMRVIWGMPQGRGVLPYRSWTGALAHLLFVTVSFLHGVFAIHPVLHKH